jgi:very-short-patch-repair endonuclease
MVCAEYDGGWHDDRRRRRADLERQELLADAGWLVVRFRARDLFPEPLVAVARVLRRLTSRGYRHAVVIERAGSSGWEP